MSNEDIRKIIGELDLYRLQKKMEGYGPIPVTIGDLFACGCYFVLQGKKNLGYKLCRTALSAYEIAPDLIERILNHIEGDEQEIAQLLNPHVEVPGWLFGNNETQRKR